MGPPKPRQMGAGMTAAIALSEYREKLAGIPEDAFIGSIVWYSIAGQVERNDGKRTIVPVRVPQDQMIEWFEQLGLDPGLLPPPIKRIDAFRNASSNSKLEYPLDDDKTAELRIEEVKYDEHQVVRHVVKITRDARREQLSLDHLATLKFLRAGRTAKAKRPTGDDVKAQILTAISTQDREKATEILGIFNEKYEDLSNHLHRPAIAAIIRGYLLQKLNAIAMKTSAACTSYTRVAGPRSTHYRNSSSSSVRDACSSRSRFSTLRVTGTCSPTPTSPRSRTSAGSCSSRSRRSTKSPRVALFRPSGPRTWPSGTPS